MDVMAFINDTMQFTLIMAVIADIHMASYILQAWIEKKVRGDQ